MPTAKSWQGHKKGLTALSLKWVLKCQGHLRDTLECKNFVVTKTSAVNNWQQIQDLRKTYFFIDFVKQIILFSGWLSSESWRPYTNQSRLLHSSHARDGRAGGRVRCTGASVCRLTLLYSGDPTAGVFCNKMPLGLHLAPETSGTFVLYPLTLVKER